MGIGKALKKWIKGLRKGAAKGYTSNYNVQMDSVVPTFNQENTLVEWRSDGLVEQKVPKDERIEKKPVDVFKEILMEEPKMNLVDLDKQIKMVQRRKEVLEDHLGQNDHSQETEVLGYLRARKFLSKFGKEFKWPATDQKLIETLCSKYKVMKVSMGAYYRNLPMEAIDELEKFSEAFSKVSKAKPLFELIVDSGGKEQKKDPILLARSPFGRWYYVLGAWDKEVEIVDDLIYNGK